MVTGVHMWEKLPDAHKVMHIIHVIPSNVSSSKTSATQSPVGSSLRNCTEIGTIISSEQIFIIYISVIQGQIWLLIFKQFDLTHGIPQLWALSLYCIILIFEAQNPFEVRMLLVLPFSSRDLISVSLQSYQQAKRSSTWLYSIFCTFHCTFVIQLRCFLTWTNMIIESLPWHSCIQNGT